MKKIALVLGFFLMAFLTKAQPEPFSITWGNTGTSEGGEDVVQAPSGSIYYCGFAVEDSENTMVTLTKLTANGEWQQEWSFGLPGKQVPFKMRMVNDELIMVGRREHPDGNVDGFWLKVDTLGNELHWSEYGSATRTETFRSFEEDADGNFIVCGFVTGAEGEGNNALLGLFDSSFSEIWVDEDSYVGNDVANSVAVIDGTEYVVAGDRMVGGGYYNFYVARFDNSGDQVWEYFEDNGYNGGCKDMLVSSEGDVIVVGESSGPGFIMFEPTFSRFSGEGGLVAWEYLESSPSSDAAFAVLETSAGNFLLTGYGNNPETGSVDVMVINTDDMANEISRKYYGISQGNDIGFSLVNAQDDGFLIAGRSGYFNAGYLLIYDQFPISSSLPDRADQKNWVVFPNPIAPGQSLKTLHPWYSALITENSGRSYEVNWPDQLIFENEGMYSIRFMNKYNNSIGSAKVICSH